MRREDLVERLSAREPWDVLDLLGSYRMLFRLLAGYTALAFVAVLLFRPGRARRRPTRPDYAPRGAFTAP